MTSSTTKAETESKDVYRRFEFPYPINVDGVTATLEEGVLHINAPTAVEQKAVAAAA